MSVTKDEMSGLIKANNDQSMASFKDTAGQIKCANDTLAELAMKEIEVLKFQEPLKFKRKANEDQYEFNLKLAETFYSAEKTNLEKVKSDLEECEKLLVERQKCILLADKSKYGWSTVKECKQHDPGDDLEDENAFTVPRDMP